MMDFNKKIRDNAKKVKLSVIIVLVILLIYRIFGSPVNDCQNGILLFIAIAPYFVIAMEMIAVFLKGKAAVFISIINIFIGLVVVLIECFLTFIGLFAAMVDGNLKALFEAIVEVAANVIFCITAGTVIILIEEKYKSNLYNVDFKKIYDNARKVKLSAIIVLVILMICRIYINNNKDSFVNFNIKDGDIFNMILFAMGLAPCFLIPLEMIAVFLKGKAAVFLSVTSIAISIPIILVEGWILFTLVFAGMLGGGWEGTLESTAELIANIIFAVTAITVFVLKEDSMKNEKKKVK